MSRFRFLPILLLALSFLGANLMGVHLHLCFDGSEPPASLHVAATDHHADHHASEAHDDLDRPAFGDALAKNGSSALDLPALLLVVVLLPLLATRRLRVPAFRLHDLVPKPLLFLRPPLRGPPPLAS